MLNRKTKFCMVTILFWFALYAYVPQMPGYAREMGASYRMIGLIAGSYGITQTLLRIPLGIGSDILGKRKIFILIGAVSAMISALIVFLFPSPAVLLAARFLAGVSAATWVTFTVMYASYYPPLEATKAVGIIQSMNRIGMFLAMLAGGVVASYYGTKSIFLLSFFVGLMALGLSLTIQEEKASVTEKAFHRSDLPAIIQNRQVRLICLLGALSQLIMYAGPLGFSPIVAGHLGATGFQLSLLTMMFIFPQIIVSLLSGTFFIRVFGEKISLIIGFSLMITLCFATPLVPHLSLLYGFQFLAGIGNAIAFPLLTGLVIRNVDMRLRNTTMGFFQAFFGLGMITGPVLVGILSQQYSLQVGFWAVGVLGLSALLIILPNQFSAEHTGVTGSQEQGH
ncbi:MAG: MFS transporter [Bacillota bacterium]|nr:MFS transporter [Bacillota bacterium]MDW7677223.1 MFS transporter [Bacillota bacterium]